MPVTIEKVVSHTLKLLFSSLAYHARVAEVSIRTIEYRMRPNQASKFFMLFLFICGG